LSWPISIPTFDRKLAPSAEEGRSRLVHRRGVSASPGLYFLGLSWQHTRGSALLGWVKDDAEHIANQIDAFRPTARGEPRAPEHIA
jgi:putative flavoprotein involved in K+ transport